MDGGRVPPDVGRTPRRPAAAVNIAWINILNAICAYYYTLRGQTEQIPAVFAEHRLDEVHILAPGRPMIEMIENQVGLAQGDYARVVGRSERLLAVCEGMHYALVAMHIRIQTAAAYEMLGKHAEAQAQLDQALTDAEPDGFVIPFAENYRYLKPLLTERLQTGWLHRSSNWEKPQSGERLGLTVRKPCRR